MTALKLRTRRGKLTAFGMAVEVARHANAKSFSWQGRYFRLLSCSGEAHANPFIDNCWRCAPLWGVVVVEVGLHAV